MDIIPKNRCHKPSWQGFRPPPPNGQCPNEQRFSLGGASLSQLVRHDVQSSFNQTIPDHNKHCRTQCCKKLWTHNDAHNCERTMPHTIVRAQSRTQCPTPTYLPDLPTRSTYPTYLLGLPTRPTYPTYLPDLPTRPNYLTYLPKIPIRPTYSTHPPTPSKQSQ